jgi:glycosyltransferase involved in cell wall biosynthesis
MALVSIVIPCKNEGINILNTVQSILQADNLLPYEIIVVDDNSTDYCAKPLYSIRDKRLRILKTRGLGAPGARNYGAENANGEILVFCDAHIFVANKWLDNMLKPLLLHDADVVSPAIAPHDNPRNIGYGQYLNSRLEVQWYTTPPEGSQEIAVSPGGCQAMFRSAFEEIGGYDRGFKVWGYEDVEISIKLWLFGFKVIVEPRVEVLHVFRTKHPYPVNLYHVHYNFLRMAVSHFNFRRYRKTLEIVNGLSTNNQIVQDVNTGHAWTQRKEYLKKRVHDDDWYFAKFGIAF